MNVSVSFVTFLSLWYFCDGISISRSTKGTQKCGTYSTRAPKIVGGRECFEGEFPWMVSLKSETGHFCGGFVISEKHVLTAAHCFLQKYAPSNNLRFDDNGKVILSSFNATVGEYSLKSPETVPEIPVAIAKLTAHPKYNPESKDNDIAIIELSEKVSIHPSVEPVCLPNNKIHFLSTKKAIAAGWGMHYHGQSPGTWKSETDKLLKVEMNIQDTEKCRRNYLNTRGENYSLPFPAKGVICAGARNKDSCAGDSGGPLMLLKDNKWTAIGIISYGKACGDYDLPSVYTDIAHFKKWIEEQMR